MAILPPPIGYLHVSGYAMLGTWMKEQTERLKAFEYAAQPTLDDGETLVEEFKKWTKRLRAERESNAT